MALLSDLDHYRINATLSDDGDRVLQCDYITDVALRLKDFKTERIWLRKKKPLSQGFYSEVWLEEQEDDPKIKRAVKAIKKDRMIEIQIDHTRELKALLEFSKAKHRRKGVFVEFLGWWEENDIVSFAMEYFPLGDLEANMTTVVDESAITEITRQLLEGLDIMHGMKFAHRDLKPANIFVAWGAPRWWVKIGDFGMSKQIEGGDAPLQTYVGTYNYMAPEFFGYVGGNADEEGFKYTQAIDLWALGCIIYRLCTQTVPFPSCPDLLPLKCFCEQKTLFPEQALRSRGISEELIALVKLLLRPEPSERLPAGDGLALLSTRPASPLSLGGSATSSQKYLSMKDPLERIPTAPLGHCPKGSPGGFQCDPQGTSKVLADKYFGYDEIARTVIPKRTMTSQQSDGGGRRPSLLQSQQLDTTPEHRGERCHKPSRSSSHTFVEGSLVAAQLDSPRSQSQLASPTAAKPGLTDRATSAPNGTPTKKSFIGKIRRNISDHSASTHSIFDNPFAGAYGPRQSEQIRELVQANTTGHAPHSAQRNEDSRAISTTGRKIIKSPLASSPDTLVPEEENRASFTQRDNSDAGDVICPSRRYFGQRYGESLGNPAFAKPATGLGIEISMTEPRKVGEQIEPLRGLEGEKQALSNLLDQAFNLVP